MVKPTVAILGFGMAASLQEMADRSGDIMLNPDTTRYGTEPMNAARFKVEYNKLLDELTKAGVTRFVLLSPIHHEDLRATRPGLPDPAAHEKLLGEYAEVIKQLADERKAIFVSLRDNANWFGAARVTSNGIHPTRTGYEFLWGYVASRLGLDSTADKGNQALLHTELGVPGDLKLAKQQERYRAALRDAIVRKNQLFFHRWRPENYTYLFGFRKREQGQNGKEIPEFDPLIAQLEKEIDRIKNEPAASVQAAKVNPPDAPIPPAAQTVLPNFDIQDGYAIELWATNPLLEKPIQMNWDDDRPALDRLLVHVSAGQSRGRGGLARSGHRRSERPSIDRQRSHHRGLLEQAGRAAGHLDGLRRGPAHPDRRGAVSRCAGPLGLLRRPEHGAVGAHRYRWRRQGRHAPRHPQRLRHGGHASHRPHAEMGTRGAPLFQPIHLYSQPPRDAVWDGAA